MNDQFEQTAEQAAAFQKVWLQSASKMLQASLGVAPNTDPEVLRQVRNGILQALAQSWDEFMRSPQFLESMKQWMEQAVGLRKMTGDFLAKMRNELQAPSRDDVDTVMLAIRHLETRLLNRIDGIAADVAALKSQKETESPTRPGASRRSTVRPSRSRRPVRPTQPGKRRES